VGQDQPDSNPIAGASRKKIAKISPEELDLVVEGLNEIIGG